MKDVSVYEALYDFDKKNEDDVIYWTSEIDKLDSHLFSFDKKMVYNLFGSSEILCDDLIVG